MLFRSAAAMERIGRIVNQPQIGIQARADFLQRLDRVKQSTAALPPQRVIFVMDYKMPTAAGRGTFINEMIELANGINLLPNDYSFWKKVSLEKILTLDPDVIICHCENSPADEARQYWQQLNFTGQRDRRVYVVTDPDWLIPAGHLAEYTMQLAQMIHPELAPPEAQP